MIGGGRHGYGCQQSAVVRVPGLEAAALAWSMGRCPWAFRESHGAAGVSFALLSNRVVRKSAPQVVWRPSFAELAEGTGSGTVGREPQKGIPGWALAS